MTMSAAERPMNDSERYFALLDLARPMNDMMVAELSTVVPPELVERRWTEFVQCRIAARLVATPRLTIADAGSRQVHFTAVPTPPEHWDRAVETLADEVRGTDVPTACHYLYDDGAARSRVVLVAHHAVHDGRALATEMQLFLRSLDGQEVPVEGRLPAAAPAPVTKPWQQSPRDRIALLRELRERQAVAATVPRDWPGSSDERRARVSPVVVSAADTRSTLDAARRQGAGALAAMSAAWMISAVDVLGGGVQGVIDLATPVDLKQGLAGSTPYGLNIAVVTNRYDVDAAQPWGVARRVRERTRESMDVGIGELMLELTRASARLGLEAGARDLAERTARTAPSLSVTNLGVIDPGSDPGWVDWLCGYLAPTPNQVAFVSGLGYRGQLVNSIVTNAVQLPGEHHAALVRGFRTTLAAMSDASDADAGRPAPSTLEGLSR